MRNNEWIESAQFRGGSAGAMVRTIAEEIERGTSTPVLVDARRSGTYDCPSCGKTHPTDVGRTVRDLKGTRIKICRTCFGLGPVVVAQNINRRIQTA